MSAHVPAPIAVRAAAPVDVPWPDAALGLTWRALGVQDAPELAVLVAAIEAADAEPFRTSLDEVTEWFDGEWKDHAHDTLAGSDTEGVLRAYAQVTTAPGDERVVRAFLTGGVHPAWRGRGVGRELVAWMEARGRQLLAASGKDVPGRLCAYLEDSAPASKALFAAAGFAPIRYYSEMRRPLRVPLPVLAVPDGLQLRPWTPDVDEAVRVAHNEAFADHWGSEPRTPETWSHGRSMFAAPWSLVAFDDATGEVAGYLLSSRYEHDWPILGYSAGYTELLGVRRAWRGRGVGTALLAAVMDLYRADGMEFVELGVDTANPSGAHGLYASLGYEVFHGSTLVTIEL
ncbi:GNAT family N-acetyltransferase (plasmid) [Cellulomonas sp. WB94]|uniref:GNAT family N-acetyltransferase n=1 Tax=Cellulomonas sp. WB94 TaxID=2173174 RepID=UPI000D57BBBF|nr:GNAT family N-acetyltransferase [Cellulomonas sp. WB94]PVU81798.1 GNAT family N-acetyltransferase [Cellulomonas sp. WB94]